MINTHKLWHMTRRLTTRHRDAGETGKHKDTRSRLPDVNNNNNSVSNPKLWWGAATMRQGLRQSWRWRPFVCSCSTKNMLDSRTANKIWKILHEAEKGSGVVNSSSWEPPLSLVITVRRQLRLYTSEHRIFNYKSHIMQNYCLFMQLTHQE